MLKVLSKEEVEESNRKLDEWWAELGWDIKNHLREMVWGIQNPIDQSLPMNYSEDFEPLAIASSLSGPMEWIGSEWKEKK